MNENARRNEYRGSFRLSSEASDEPINEHTHKHRKEMRSGGLKMAFWHILLVVLMGGGTVAWERWIKHISAKEPEASQPYMPITITVTNATPVEVRNSGFMKPSPIQTAYSNLINQASEEGYQAGWRNGVNVIIDFYAGKLSNATHAAQKATQDHEEWMANRKLPQP